MLSIITTFNPRATNIQDIRTAIQSWIKQPEVTEIFIYGVEEIDFYRLSDKIKYISSSGIPKVKDLIAYLNSYAKNIFVAYINSDIHLVGDLGQVFESIKVKERFLISGWRKDILREELFAWNLKSEVGVQLHGGMDYFIFPKGAFMNFPDYFIGRGMFDYAFIWYAIRNKYKIFNASGSILALHIIHNKNNLGSSYHEYYWSDEYIFNRKLIHFSILYLYPLFRSHYSIINYRLVSNSWIKRYVPTSFEYVVGVLYQLLLPYHKRLKYLLFFGGKFYRWLNSKKLSR
jgi:hypothetical protein